MANYTLETIAKQQGSMKKLKDSNGIMKTIKKGQKK